MRNSLLIGISLSEHITIYYQILVFDLKITGLWVLGCIFAVP